MTPLLIELAFVFMLTVQIGFSAWTANKLIDHITDKELHK